jgi:hypothetical protein
MGTWCQHIGNSKIQKEKDKRMRVKLWLHLQLHKKYHKLMGTSCEMYYGLYDGIQRPQMRVLPKTGAHLTMASHECLFSLCTQPQALPCNFILQNINCPI